MFLINSTMTVLVNLIIIVANLTRLYGWINQIMLGGALTRNSGTMIKLTKTVGKLTRKFNQVIPNSVNFRLTRKLIVRPALFWNFSNLSVRCLLQSYWNTVITTRGEWSYLGNKVLFYLAILHSTQHWYAHSFIYNLENLNLQLVV
jgi:hypothetical protein